MQQITKEMILQNFIDAIEYKDGYVDSEDKKLLEKVIGRELENLSKWSLSDYLDFADDALIDGVTYALREIDLLTADDFGLPSTAEVRFDELGQLDDVEESIGEWLSDTYGFTHYGFKYEPNPEKELFVITDIDWDIRN